MDEVILELAKWLYDQEDHDYSFEHAHNGVRSIYLDRASDLIKIVQKLIKNNT